MTDCKVKYERPWRCRAGVVLTTPNLIGGSIVAIIQSTEECPSFPVIEGVEFRHLERFPGYAADSTGRIWSCRNRNGKGKPKTWRVLKPAPNRYGYMKLSLRQNAKKTHVLRCVLVLEAFSGPRPPDLQVRHLDGSRTNDCIDNLAWGTAKENIRDAMNHGTHNCLHQRGETHPEAKLTENDVRRIRDLAKTMFHNRIARMFNVVPQTIDKIVSKKAWKHIS